MNKYIFLISVVIILATVSITNARIVHKDKDANPPTPPPTKIIK